MRMFAISDDRDALTGLRLVGVGGQYLTEKKKIEACVDKVQADPGIAILLITEACAALIPERVSKLKLSSANPLLVVMPASGGSSRQPDSITNLIREAIGIKV